MTRRIARKQEWVFPLFSPDSYDRLSLNFHRFVVLYISCDTRSVGLGQYCLLKVYNGFQCNININTYYLITTEFSVISFNPPTNNFEEKKQKKNQKCLHTDYSEYTLHLIFMHDIIILTQNEAMGARPPSLAVAAPITSF